MRMKCISVKGQQADNIAYGPKCLETRTWRTSYRGPLLVAKSRRPRSGDCTKLGKAIVSCRVTDVRPMQPADEELACVKWRPGLFVWVLEDRRPLARPFPVRGIPGVYEVEVPEGALA